MLPGAYLGLCSRCIQRCARLSSPHRARRPASPFLTRNLRIRPYEAFAPLPPSRLPKPKKPKVSKAYRSRKWGRRLFYLGLTTTAIWALDKQFYASSLARTMSTFSLGIVVALDYKINFRPDPWIGDIQSLHTRNAERLFSLLRANGGKSKGDKRRVVANVWNRSVPQDWASYCYAIRHPTPRIPKDVC